MATLLKCQKSNRPLIPSDSPRVEKVTVSTDTVSVDLAEKWI
jgi:hypothetical protein